MGIKRTFTGELDRRVELYLHDRGAASVTGETAENNVLLGPISAKLEDGGGNEEEDGKIYYVSNRTYTIRFVEDVWLKGEQMFVRDQDGDWYVYSVKMIGRKEFLQLKTNKSE